MRPNLALISLLWAALLVLVTSLLSGNSLLMVLMTPILTLVVLGLLFTPPQVRSIVRRGFPTMVWTDEELEIELVIEVEGGFGMVSVFDPLPEEFELSQGANYMAFWVWKSGITTKRYSVICRKRGECHIQPSQWRSWHGLFLRSEKAGQADNPMSTLVMPKPAAVPYGRVTKEHARLPSIGSTLTKIGIATTDFRELRQYTHGDPLKAINWKATARRLAAGQQMPVTNQYESEGRRAVWIFTDASTAMMVGDNLRNPLELCLRLTMGAARYFLRKGARVGMFAFGADAAIIYPESGNRQLIRISNAIARLTPGPSTDGLLGAVEQVRRSLAKDAPLSVVFTRLDLPDPEPLKAGVRRLAIAGLRSRRRTPPIIVGVGGYNWMQTHDWYERNASALLHLATRPLVRSLHADGARVLEWSPDREAVSHETEAAL